jgi:oxygen-independent coproporphyrinogen-3 oxidase
LKSAGYRHYEISNFAKPGHECAHNIVYWECSEYLGFGAGAHSYFNKQRFNNVSGIEDFIGKLNRHESPAENYSDIAEKEQISEYMFMGLRMTKGINLKEFKEKFGIDVFDIYGGQIANLEGKGLLINDSKVLKLSKKGLDLANLVFMEFI